MSKANSFYEKHVSNYQKLTSLWFPARHNKLISLLPSKKSLALLDVGCGTGVMLENIDSKHLGHKLYGVDLSKPMIEFAKKQYPDFNLQVADAQDLPFDENKFNIITNAISFHHYNDPYKAITEAYRVLRSDGQFLLMDISPKHSVVRILNDLGARYIVRDGHVAFQSLDNIKILFERAGFQNISQQFVGFPGVWITKGSKT